MRVIVYYPRGSAAAIAFAIALAGRPAAAQEVFVQADGAANVGYLQTTQRRPDPVDPNVPAEDRKPDTVSSVFTDIRPAILLQRGSPRLTWRVGYLLSAALNVDNQSVAYSNQGNAALIAELSPFSTIAFNASVAQGGSPFLLSAQPAEQGKPEIRAPGDPSTISATMSESLAWEFGRQLSLQQSLSGNVSAPQDQFDKRNSALTGTLALERMFGRDNVGAEARASMSWLQPPRADLDPYSILTTALLARWNHDFSKTWNGLATAGVQQVYSDAGSQPLVLVPTASATVRYAVEGAAGSLDVSHGAATNIRVGSVSLTDQITAHGIVTLDAIGARVLSFSAGVLHNEPIGEVVAELAPATGNALQADAGYTMAIAKNALLSARYTLAYQFGQTDINPTTVHVFLLGVTGTINTSPAGKRALPRSGDRVDKSDAQGFPVVPADDSQTP